MKPSSRSAMGLASIEYLVGECSEAPEKLTVDSAGRARYESHCNAGNPDRPEIGTFETKLSAGDVESLAGAFANPSFAALPDHWGQVKSGDRYRRIVVTTQDGKSEKLLGTKLPIDTELGRLAGRLDALLAEVSQHPLKTLRLELTEPVLNTHGTLRTVIVLSNRGTEPLAIRSPVELAGEKDGWLRLDLWPDKPPSQVRQEDTRNARAEKVELLQPTDALQGLKTILELPAQGSLSFRVDARIEEASAGATLVRLTYATYAGGTAGRALVGEVMSRPVKVDVRLKGAP